LPKIGILAIQGDVKEHTLVLNKIGAEVVEVRLPDELEGLDGLVIPGGESTTIIQLIDLYGLRKPLISKIQAGMPAWGTCAGMVVLAGSLIDEKPDPLHLMDIEVSRNAFGAQINSFETFISVKDIGEPKIRAVFIRAPVVTKVGKNVEIMAKLENDIPVCVRDGNMLATAFHPELTQDTRIHQYFVDLANKSIDSRD
tara:strand:+ start:226 stop:819 length:594 start_codon:yes stop_codon:yes gene_type:complete